MCDEFHLHLVPDDIRRASICRSSNTHMFRLMQTKEVAKSAMDHLSHEAIEAWISQHPLKVAHSLPAADPTAVYMSKLCGEKRVLLYSGSGDTGSYNTAADILGNHRPSSNISWSEQVREAVPPHILSRFRRGGHENGCVTDALVVLSGKPWQLVTFPQTFV